MALVKAAEHQRIQENVVEDLVLMFSQVEIMKMQQIFQVHVNEKESFLLIVMYEVY